MKLAMSCVTLAIECFQRSAPRGEVCWLQAVRDITPHMISCFDRANSNEVKTHVLHCLFETLKYSNKSGASIESSSKIRAWVTDVLLNNLTVHSGIGGRFLLVWKSEMYSGNDARSCVHPFRS